MFHEVSFWFFWQLWINFSSTNFTLRLCVHCFSWNLIQPYYDVRHYKRYWNVALCLSILQYMSQRRENRGRWVGVMQSTSVPGKEQQRKCINKIKTVEKGSSLGDVQTWTLKAAWPTFLVLFMINAHYLLLNFSIHY